MAVSTPEEYNVQLLQVPLAVTPDSTIDSFKHGLFARLILVSLDFLFKNHSQNLLILF
jgi:hypothetical protein